MHGVVYAEWGKLVLLLIVVMLNVIMLSGMAPLSGIALLVRLRALTANITFKLERPAKDLHYSLFSALLYHVRYLSTLLYKRIQ